MCKKPRPGEEMIRLPSSFIPQEEKEIPKTPTPPSTPSEKKTPPKKVEEMKKPPKK